MIKRFFGLIILMAALASCDDKKDINGENSGYPTADLKPAEKRNVLLLRGLNFSQAVTTEILSRLAESEFGPDVNHMSVFTPDQGPLGGPVLDTIKNRFQLSQAPIPILVNTTPLSSPNAILDDTESSIRRRSVASVEHTVRENDTSWTVFNKVRIWEDTLAPNFKIATYLLADIPGVQYMSENIDLRPQESPDVVERNDSLATWVTDFPNADSSGTIAKKGDVFTHRSVLLNAYRERTWGIALQEYTPFGAQFFENDLIGTKSTPIEHHFVKPSAFEDDDFDANFEFEPVFLSIIWSEDPMTGEVEYLNSFWSK